MFEVPSKKGLRKVLVDEETVKNNTKPKYIFKEAV